jgi:hypothetical protein
VDRQIGSGEALCVGEESGVLFDARLLRRKKVDQLARALALEKNADLTQLIVLVLDPCLLEGGKEILLDPFVRVGLGERGAENIAPREETASFAGAGYVRDIILVDEADSRVPRRGPSCRRRRRAAC